MWSFESLREGSEIQLVINSQLPHYLFLISIPQTFIFTIPHLPNSSFLSHQWFLDRTLFNVFAPG